MKFSDSKSVKKSKKSLSLLSLVSLTIVGLSWVMRRQSRRRKFAQEMQSIDKRVGLHLQGVKKFYHDFLIPHRGNNHRPHILHPHAVRFFAGSLIALKLFLVITLFIFFPQAAWLSATVEQQMVDLTNEYRQSLGAPILVRNQYLDAVAHQRAQDMIDRNYFSHYSPEGKKPWEWIDPKQYPYERFGENLATDFITAKAVMSAFQASPSHDKNLRNPKYLDIGIAVVSGRLDNQETNVMVVFYGATKEAPVVAPFAAKEEVKPTSTVAISVPTSTVPTTTPIVVTEPLVRPPQPKGIIVYDTASTSVGQIIPVEPSQVQTKPSVAGIEEDLVKPADDQVVTVSAGDHWWKQVISWSRDFYFLILLAFVFIALLNIFVAIKVQHHSIIISSIFMIVLAASLWVFDWHRLESIPALMRILGITL